MGLRSYILEHIVFDFEFSGCVCIVSMLCLILNFQSLCLILNFFGFVFSFELFFYLNFEFSGKKKNPKFFFCFKKHGYRFEAITTIINVAIGPNPIATVIKTQL